MAIMGRIYSNASGTVLWTGRDEQEAWKENFVSALVRSEMIESDLATMNVKERDWLVALCQNKYWSRLWIMHIES